MAEAPRLFQPGAGDTDPTADPVLDQVRFVFEQLNFLPTGTAEAEVAAKLVPSVGEYVDSNEYLEAQLDDASQARLKDSYKTVVDQARLVLAISRRTSVDHGWLAGWLRNSETSDVYMGPGQFVRYLDLSAWVAHGPKDDFRPFLANLVKERTKGESKGFWNDPYVSSGMEQDATTHIRDVLGSYSIANLLEVDGKLHQSIADRKRASEFWHGHRRGVFGFIVKHRSKNHGLDEFAKITGI